MDTGITRQRMISRIIRAEGSLVALGDGSKIYARMISDPKRISDVIRGADIDIKCDAVFEFGGENYGIINESMSVKLGHEDYVLKTLHPEFKQGICIRLKAAANRA